jgi:hypothetical protein
VPGVLPNGQLAAVMGEAAMSRRAPARAVRELLISGTGERQFVDQFVDQDPQHALSRRMSLAHLLAVSCGNGRWRSRQE